MKRIYDIQRPKGLVKGSTLAVVSASAPSASRDVDLGVAWLEDCGFRVRVMPHAKASYGYLAGTDEQRLADLIEAVESPEIEGILCTRGGYGAGRLLPHLPWQRWRDEAIPCKLLMGFSDVTMLHQAFFQELGWVSYYSPMLTSNLLNDTQDWTRQQWLSAISTSTFSTFEALPYAFPNLDAYHCLQAGTVEGLLHGGNLSLLAALCGTPWQPSFQDCIVVIEDWKEKYYTLDRQFTQLIQAGVFDGAKAILFADFSQIEEEPIRSLAEQLAWLCKDLSIPMGYGYTIGHGEQTLTIPLGVEARFDTSAGILSLLASPLLPH